MVDGPSSSLSLTITEALSGTGTVGYGDAFGDRISLVDSYGVYSGIDLSTATMETGEPNPLSVTKTWWFEYLLLNDHPNNLRVRAYGGSGVVKIAVFRSTNAATDPATGVDPVFADLALVASSTTGDVTWATSDDDASYYVQVGLASGAGTGWSLEYTFADPSDGGTFDTALVQGASYGGSTLDVWNSILEAGEPTPTTGEIRSGWIQWTCPTPSPGQMTVTSNFSGSTGVHGLTVYTGSAVGALTLVISSGDVSAGNPAMVQFTPTAGTVYYFDVSTSLDRGTFSVSWSGPANLSTPAQVFQYVRVEVFDYTGMTKITEIPRRFGVKFQELLNAAGSGEFSVHLNDEILTAYPTLFNHRNIVKFWLGSTCASAFRIQVRETTLVTGEGVSGFIRTVSGPSVQYLLDDFMVKHYLSPRPWTTFDDRNYNWTAPSQNWFNPARWTDHYNVNSLKNPPGGKPGTVAKKRPKYGFPKKWKDKNAKWMWLSTHRNQNEGNYACPRPIRGLHYYRKDVYIAKNGTPVRLYASADATLSVFLDGDLVLNRDGKEKGYKTYIFYDAILDKGVHTIAILMQSLHNLNIGDKNEAVLFSMARIGSNGKPAAWLMRSGRGWYSYHGWGVQTWNRAQVLLNLIAEAAARGNSSAANLGIGFSSTADSTGAGWPGAPDPPSLRISTSVLAVQGQLSEGDGFDVWVDPSSMTVKAYNRMGTDKSQSVSLTPGMNLLDWKAKNTDNVKNDILVRYERGYVGVTDNPSIASYGHREGGIELGGVQDEHTAVVVTQQAMAGVTSAVLEAGSPDVMPRDEFEGDGSVIGIEGAFPFLDYGLGDVISGPNENGALVRNRVLGLGCTENADGYLTFDPVLEVLG